MTANSSNVKENLALGKIAHFFGHKYGMKNIDKILKICGITDCPEGSKTEKIAAILNRFYFADKDSFQAFFETLLENHELIPSDREQLNVNLQPLGYGLNENKLVPSQSKEIILSQSRPYDVFKIIEKIMQTTNNRVFLIDAYVDDSLFALYFESLKPTVEIKVLTKNMYTKFEAVGRKFKSQGSNFEVRTSNEIHDRTLIVDNRAWLFGQSLKDAGNKPLSIIELDDVVQAEKLFKDLWGRAKIII
jgi:hypothetical protein